MSFDWLTSELAGWEQSGRLRRRRTVQPLADGRIEVDGRTLVNLAANDYLGLASHPRLKEAAEQALADSGLGARSSPLVSGRTRWHDRLEQHLARFEQAEAAILFPSGYAANTGTITALVEREDSVFCDRLNHASLIDGCRLSGARFHLYPHLDMAALEKDLAAAAGRRRRLIVTDSVFSMDGDVAPLKELADLAESYDALLLVDEAHGTGVLGTTGRGLVELSGIPDDRLVRVGTFSKALGSQGAFVTGPKLLIDWLWNRARSQVFSTAFLPAIAAAGCAALDLIDEEPQRRVRLLELSGRLRAALEEADIPSWPTTVNTPIVPVLLGDELRTLDAARQLEEAGFLVAAIRPPTVPQGTSRLRISLHSQVSDDELDRLVMELKRLSRN